MITLAPSTSIPNSYSLNWSAQQTHILDGLRNLIGQDELLLTDVTLACDGEYVQAHKLVLSLCSSFFKDLFQKNRADKSNTIVILGNVSAQNLRYLLQFMYHGRVDIPSKDVDSFLQAGNVLKIEGLIGNVGDNGQAFDSQSASVNVPSHSVPSTSTRSSTRSYPPPGPASKKAAMAMASSSETSQAKRPRMSEQSTSSTPTTTSLQIKIIGTGASSNVDQSSVDPLDGDGAEGAAFHPGEMEGDAEENVDFNNVKSEPIQVFSGFEESGHSGMEGEGVDEDSYEESVGDDSYGLPPEGNLSVTPSAAVSVPAPGPSTSSQAGRSRGSMPVILDGRSFYAVVASKSSGWVKAKCLTCARSDSKTILIKGAINGTSNFLMHLKRKHPEQFEAYNLQKALVKRTKGSTHKKNT